MIALPLSHRGIVEVRSKVEEDWSTEPMVEAMNGRSRNKAVVSPSSGNHIVFVDRPRKDPAVDEHCETGEELATISDQASCSSLAGFR